MAYPSSDSGSASRPASGITSASQKSRSRAPSISSDRPSTIGHGLMSPPLSISPDAAFIAASAASQIVTNDHDNHANTWYDQHGIEPSSETALVSNAALQLVNNFLDQLLFSFLSIARSTSLAALRPAVTEVLKPKLAKDAINQADEELREYLGGGDDEDMLQSQTPDSPKDWDLELVWKRTRLRCMVYSSLGDMEEEDEDFYMEQEHLDGGDETLGETVSPAVAIFLTSILEFMGEQALTSAGQAAYHRMRFIFEKERKDTGAAASSAPVAERITVEEVDMDRVAFDRTIGRLWRAWKKRIRSPITDVHAFQQRSIPHELGRPSGHTRQASQDDSTIAGTISEAGEARDDVSSKLDKGENAEEEVAEKQSAEVEEPTEGDKAEAEAAPVVERDEEEWLSLALSVALPLGEKDVTEILLPGLGYYSDDEELDGDDEHDAFGRKQKKSTVDPSRPKSLMIFSHAIIAGLPTPTLSEPRTPEMPYSRKRANSLPTPSTSPYASSAKRVKPSEDEEEHADGEEKTEEKAGETVASSPNADKEAESDTPAETTDAETDKAIAPKAAKQKKRPSFPPPLQTTIIGAAITTTSPRAVPVSSMTADNSSGREDADEEFDEFTEEPEIMTSSRVSISGRSNSPSASEHGRPVSMSPSLPARSPSVHSLRVIDVTGPRSPVTRSRNGSIDIVHEPVAPSRASNTSRTSSISVQAIAEEGNARSVEQASVSSHPRSSLTGTKMARSQTSESISEAEEITVAKRQVTSHPADPKPVPAKSSVQPAQSAAQRYTASPTPSQISMRLPPPPTATAPTKVTILSSTTSSGTFFLDDKPEVPAKTNETVLPERSAKRQGISSASAIAGAAAAAVAAGAVAAGAAAASSTHTSSPLREQPPSPSRAINQGPSPSSGRDQQARAQAQAQAQAQTQAQAQAQAQARAEAQLRAEAEAAGRKQSVASSISSSTSKFKPKRSSEESTVMRPEDVARNFEQLIQSDQTIQYTLTPENMRDMDSTRSLHDGSSIVVKSRKSEDARQTGDRSRSSSVNNRGEDKRSASISRANTFETTRSTETTSTVKLSGPVPRSPRSIAPSVTSMSSRARGPGPQAREARVPRESMADFAEFIRGTGPAGGSVVPPASRNGTMNGSVSNAMRTLNSAAGMSKTSIDSGRMSTFSSRQRYQAREAVVDKDDNSDLIDFIRRGPPTVAGGASNPRIPRTVAPFRTTMDSDQMSGAVGGRAVDANIPNLRYSAASTSVTESSMGSSAGLLKKDHKQPSPRIGAGQQSASNMFDGPGDMPMPKRKTRRVKDPYAIDLSDEEDEFDVVLPISGGGRRPAPAAKEESLMDFLNSVPPPADTNPVLFDIPQTRSRQQPPVPKKKASAPSLMSRFTRNNSISSNSNSNSRGLNSSSGSHMGFGGFDSRSLISRAGSTMTGRSRNHIPIQVNIPPGLDKYGTTSSMASQQSSMSGANRPVAASSGSGRVPMKKFEPREAQPTASRATQDLADFFRNSGPPQSFRG